MRRPLLGLLAVTLVIALAWSRNEPRGDAAPPGPPVDPGSAWAPPSLAPSHPPPQRNVFAFEERQAAAPEASASAAGAPVASVEPAPAPLLRLVGFVRRAGALLAVLALRDDVLVLGAGESGAGLQVTRVDEEAGVQVRLEDGTPLHLHVDE